MKYAETLFYETELQTLDALKKRLNLSSRSDVLRLLMAKVDTDSLTPEDAALIKDEAA